MLKTYSNSFYYYSANKYSDLSVSFIEKKFKANIYYTTFNLHLSFLKRKNLIKRKHIYTWILYFNLLSNWSSEYRFYKKFSKFFTNLNFSKYTYFWPKVLENSLPLGFTNVAVSKIQTLLRFPPLLKDYKVRIFFINYFKQLITSNSALNSLPLSPTPNHSLILQATNEYYYLNKQHTPNIYPLVIFPGQLHLQYLVELYKVLILLSLLLLK